MSKVFDGARDAIVYSAVKTVTRGALQLVYNGLLLLSKKESAKRKVENAKRRPAETPGNSSRDERPSRRS